jgi:hypothetical protein
LTGRTYAADGDNDGRVLRIGKRTPLWHHRHNMHVEIEVTAQCVCGDEMCVWTVGSSMTSLDQKPCFLSYEIPILIISLNQGFCSVWITTVEILVLAPEAVGNKHLFVLLDWCLLHDGRLGSWGSFF